MYSFEARAKESFGGPWVYGNVVTDKKGNPYIIRVLGAEPVKVLKETVCPRLDCGKKVYANDILLVMRGEEYRYVRVIYDDWRSGFRIEDGRIAGDSEDDLRKLFEDIIMGMNGIRFAVAGNAVENSWLDKDIYPKEWCY